MFKKFRVPIIIVGAMLLIASVATSNAELGTTTRSFSEMVLWPGIILLLFGMGQAVKEHFAARAIVQASDSQNQNVPAQVAQGRKPWLLIVGLFLLVAPIVMLGSAINDGAGLELLRFMPIAAIAIIAGIIFLVRGIFQK